jgi:hypothetical protein
MEESGRVVRREWTLARGLRRRWTRSLRRRRGPCVRCSQHHPSRPVGMERTHSRKDGPRPPHYPVTLHLVVRELDAATREALSLVPAGSPDRGYFGCRSGSVAWPTWRRRTGSRRRESWASRGVTRCTLLWSTEVLRQGVTHRCRTCAVLAIPRAEGGDDLGAVRSSSVRRRPLRGVDGLLRAAPRRVGASDPGHPASDDGDRGHRGARGEHD